MTTTAAATRSRRRRTRGVVGLLIPLARGMLLLTVPATVHMTVANGRQVVERRPYAVSGDPNTIAVPATGITQLGRSGAEELVER